MVSLLLVNCRFARRRQELSEEEIAKQAEKEAKKAEREKKKAEKEAMPAKAKSAYVIYTVEMRESVKADHPDVDAKELVKIIGSMWSGLSEDDKLPYEAKAAEDKERYAKECEEAGIEVAAPTKGAKKAKVRPPSLARAPIPHAALRGAPRFGNFRPGSRAHISS